MFYKLFYPYYLFTSKVDHFYHFFQKDNLFGKNTTFINFGYWPSRDYDEAAMKLAFALGDYALLKPSQRVVSVGCGFADELFLWKSHYQLESVLGVNINFSQLQAVSPLGQFEGISFCQADAKSLILQIHSVDRILALESAFHFNTREIFFQEAYLALKPGGMIGLADIILTDEIFNLFQRAILKIVYRIFKIPSANRQNWSEYSSSLKRAGFEDIQKKEISRRVFKGFIVYLIKNNSMKGKLTKLSLMLLKFIFSGKFTFSYVLVRATKPLGSA